MNEAKKFYDLLTAIPSDKLLHVVAASALTALLGLIMPFDGQLVVMSAIFVGKEIYDKASGRGTCEWGDIIADYVGFVIGVL